MSDIRIQITGGGIYGADGKEVPVGTELTVKEEPAAWAGRYAVLSGGDEVKVKGGKRGVTNPAPAKYEARAKGDVFVIVDGDGKEYGAALTEADAKDFNGLSDEDKAAFATEHAKA